MTHNRYSAKFCIARPILDFFIGLGNPWINSTSELDTLIPRFLFIKEE